MVTAMASPIPGFPDLTRAARSAFRSEAAELFVQAHGRVLDVSPVSVESALSSVDSYQHHTDSLDGAEGTYDTVISVLRSTVEGSLSDLASELARLVAPDGRLLFIEPTRTNGITGRVQRFGRVATRISAQLRLHTGFRIALWRAGLSVTEVERKELPRAWPLTSVAIGVAIPSPKMPDGEMPTSFGSS